MSNDIYADYCLWISYVIVIVAECIAAPFAFKRKLVLSAFLKILLGSIRVYCTIVSLSSFVLIFEWQVNRINHKKSYRNKGRNNHKDLVIPFKKCRKPLVETLKIASKEVKNGTALSVRYDWIISRNSCLISIKHILKNIVLKEISYSLNVLEFFSDFSDSLQDDIILHCLWYREPSNWIWIKQSLNDNLNLVIDSN